MTKANRNSGAKRPARSSTRSRPAGAGVEALTGRQRARRLAEVSKASLGHQSEAAASSRALVIARELDRSGRRKMAKSFRRCVAAANEKESARSPYQCQRKTSTVACPMCLLEIQLSLFDWMTSDHRLAGRSAEWITIASPRWQRPVGNLSSFSIRKAKRQIYALLKETGMPKSIAFGRFEVVLHRALTGALVWRPHFHIVLIADDLQLAVGGLRRGLKSHGPRTLVTRPVSDFRRLTSYLNKGISGLKEEYVANGSVRTRGKPLSGHGGAELELFTYMLKRPLKDLVLNHGIRLPRSIHSS